MLATIISILEKNILEHAILNSKLVLTKYEAEGFYDSSILM